jgi:hypothetical protein
MRAWFLPNEPILFLSSSHLWPNRDGRFRLDVRGTRLKGEGQGDVSRCLPLAYLAPDIVEAILQGRQPVELTVLRLKRIGLPLSWVEQRRLLGFES